MVGLALGIVLMHHVGGVHQHAADHRRSAVPTAATAALGSAAHPATRSATPGPAIDPDDTARLRDRTGDGAGTAMTGHLCLAVLAGLVLVTGLLLGVAGWQPAGWHPPVPGLAARPSSRAPPVPRRLAQLRVLRL